MTSDDLNIHPVRRALSFVLPFLITIVFLYFAFRNVDLDAAFSLIVEASFGWVLVFILVFFLSHFVRAIRWKVIISSVKKNTSLLNLFGSVMIGYGVNCVIPRLGEVYRGLFLGRWEGLSRTSMFGTVVVERIIDIIALGLSCLVSVYIYSGDLLNEVEWLKMSLIAGFALMGLAIVVLYLVVKLKENFYNSIVKFAGKFSKKLGDFLAEIFTTLVEGFSSIRGIKNYLLTMIYTVLIMLLYALNSYVGFFMLELNNHYEISFGLAWIVMTLSAFGVVFPTPGGTGSYHIIAIFVLTNLFHFSSDSSGAYALLTHFISYVSFIITPFVLLFFINKKIQKKGGRKENFLSVFKLRPDEK